MDAEFDFDTLAIFGLVLLALFERRFGVANAALRCDGGASGNSAQAFCADTKAAEKIRKVRRDFTVSGLVI